MYLALTIGLRAMPLTASVYRYKAWWVFCKLLKISQFFLNVLFVRHRDIFEYFISKLCISPKLKLNFFYDHISEEHVHDYVLQVCKKKSDNIKHFRHYLYVQIGKTLHNRMTGVILNNKGNVCVCECVSTSIRKLKRRRICSRKKKKEIHYTRFSPHPNFFLIKYLIRVNTSVLFYTRLSWRTTTTTIYSWIKLVLSTDVTADSSLNWRIPLSKNDFHRQINEKCTRRSQCEINECRCVRIRWSDSSSRR